MITLKTLQEHVQNIILNGLKEPDLFIDSRIEIYIGDFWGRVLHALSDDFPETRALLGKNAFNDLVRAYIRKEPSTFANLAEIGFRFPKFVRRHVLAKKNKRLVETVEFEWALVEARNFFSDPGIHSVSSVYIDTKFQLNPSVRFQMRRRKMHLIWNNKGHVRIRAVSPREYQFLNIFRTPRTLTSACLRFQKVGASPREVEKYFKTWRSEHLL